ncbi:flagellar protein FlaG [Bacillus horti]|uniref:Flagellar protein FlaG n=1 Tax=Caldalkalibacillus horti TaxID=77523 RepID=A0ABT9VZC8_9BACI|nr:flagellar protein FlaG [Bacillus horti]MDQ0166334.1 flagellar protein FlaG [Bacillus horti]
MDSIRISGEASSPRVPLNKTAQSQIRGDKSIQQDQSQAQLPQNIGEMIKGANHFFKSTNTHVQFHLHEGLNTYYVEIRNSETNEVIKEVPPKKFLDIVEKLQELAGILIDERI